MPIFLNLILVLHYIRVSIFREQNIKFLKSNYKFSAILFQMPKNLKFSHSIWSTKSKINNYWYW